MGCRGGWWSERENDLAVAAVNPVAGWVLQALRAAAAVYKLALHQNIAGHHRTWITVEVEREQVDVPVRAVARNSVVKADRELAPVSVARQHHGVDRCARCEVDAGFDTAVDRDVDDLFTAGATTFDRKWDVGDLSARRAKRNQEPECDRAHKGRREHLGL